MIKTGICSYGMSGKLFHAPFVQGHPGFELSAIVERNKNESREKYPESRLLRSVDELLAQEDIQLIVVNTPVQTHYEYVKKALIAGKNVIAEKPFTVDAREAAALDKIARDQNLFLSIYQNRRYDGDYRQIKKIVESGELGDLKEVEIRYDRFRPGVSGKLHKEGNLPGAGTLHDLGAHLIDQALQLFGWPKQLFADIRILRDRESEANDYFEILLFYPRLRVRLKSTVIAKESSYAYVLHGTTGSFLQQRSDMQEELLLKDVKPTLADWCPSPSSPDGILNTLKNGKDSRIQTTSSAGNYMGYYDDVFHALAGNGPNPVPAADAVKSMKIIDASIESALAGTTIQV